MNSSVKWRNVVPNEREFVHDPKTDLAFNRTRIHPWSEEIWHSTNGHLRMRPWMDVRLGWKYKSLVEIYFYFSSVYFRSFSPKLGPPILATKSCIKPWRPKWNPAGIGANWLAIKAMDTWMKSQRNYSHGDLEKIPTKMVLIHWQLKPKILKIWYMVLDSTCKGHFGTNSRQIWPPKVGFFDQEFQVLHPSVLKWGHKLAQIWWNTQFHLSKRTISI